MHEHQHIKLTRQRVHIFQIGSWNKVWKKLTWKLNVYFWFVCFSRHNYNIILTTLYSPKAHKFHPDDTNQCLNNKSGNHRILYIDLLEFLFLHRGNFVLIARTELHDRS